MGRTYSACAGLLLARQEAMAASLVLGLDVSPPASPVLTIADGVATVPLRLVNVAVTSPDYLTGANDVDRVLIWGDVDPTANPSVQPLEASSAWIVYAPIVQVTLATGNGSKRLWARLRDRTGNVTLPATNVVALDSTLPYTTITTGLDRAVVSLITGHNSASFAWIGSAAFDRHEVRVVPSAGSTQQAGVLLEGVNHAPAHAANTPRTTIISGAALLAASPGNGPKVLKAFIRVGGRWSL